MGSDTYDIHFIAGSVGIGTDDPTENLDINGDVRIRGGLYDFFNNVGGNGELLTSTGAGVSWTNTATTPAGQSIVEQQASTPYYITASDVTLGVSTAGFIDTNIVAKDGRIGIGTDDPTALLNVYGEVSPYILVEDGNPAENQARINFKTPSYEWTTGVHGGDSGKYKVSYASAHGGNDYLTILTSGDVGINSTAPIATLDVNGTLNVSGVSTFQDNVNLGDGDRLRLGDSQDLQIYHGGSNSIIQDSGDGDLFIAGDNVVRITNSGFTETKALFTTNGSVELYYDNSKKFETTNLGVKVTGETDLTGELNFTGANEKYVDFFTDNDSGSTYSANLRLVNNAANSFHTAVKMYRGGAVELYHNNGKKLETNQYGVTVIGNTLH